jgi:hypothetical protein
VVLLVRRHGVIGAVAGACAIEGATGEGHSSVMLPPDLMSAIGCSSGELVDVEILPACELPPAKRVRVQPDDMEFLELAAAEGVSTTVHAALASTQAVWVGQAFQVALKGKPFTLEVVEVDPLPAGRVVESSTSVDFSVPIPRMSLGSEPASEGGHRLGGVRRPSSAVSRPGSAVSRPGSAVSHPETDTLSAPTGLSGPSSRLLPAHKPLRPPRAEATVVPQERPSTGRFGRLRQLRSARPLSEERIPPSEVGTAPPIASEPVPVVTDPPPPEARPQSAWIGSGRRLGDRRSTSPVLVSPQRRAKERGVRKAASPTGFSG